MAEGRVERFAFPRLDEMPQAVADQAEQAAAHSRERELATAVAAASAEAAAETEARLRAELSECLENSHARALRALCEQLGQARAAFERLLEQRAAASRELALALARVLVPRALARAPLADIEAMLRDTVRRLERNPRLELRLPQELVVQGRNLLERVAAETGYSGELVVSADATLGPGDARLCWQDGAAVRDLDELEAEALGLIDAWLPELNPEGEPATESSRPEFVPFRPSLTKGGEP